MIAMDAFEQHQADKAIWEKIQRGELPLVSNDPTEIELARDHQAHGDAVALESMSWASARTLEGVAAALEEITLVSESFSATDCIRFMRNVASRMRQPF